MEGKIINELKSCIGKEYVLTSKEDMVLYSYDAQLLESLPQAVVEPVSTIDVANIVKIANRERIPITPRGSSTGLSCGAVTFRGGRTFNIMRMKIINRGD